MPDYTKFEKARIIGARALQIGSNAPILIKIEKEELEKINYDPIKIAEMEFESGILPITVHRPLPKKIHGKEEMVEIIEETDADGESKKKQKEAIKEEVAEEVKQDELEEEEKEEKPEEAEEQEEDAAENF